ncbi:MAG: inositol monophosphatase family protein [Thermomicrobiales bacterium]
MLEQTMIPAGARETAVTAAREAGVLLRERLDSARRVEFKGAVDLVTDADRASEALIAARIREALPDHVIFGEEGTGGPAAGIDRSSYVWIIDPLDGTTNYSHGYPHFAVSIALEYRGQTILGAVYDPMRDELFVAERDQGATLNDVPISVSGTDLLIRSLLATGFPYDLDQRDENARMWDAFLNTTQGTRRDGAAALNLCYVASGRLDGFWERPLQPWDLAAGALIVQEAGGTVTAYFADDFDPFQREAIVSNGHLHEQMTEVIRRHAAP